MYHKANEIFISITILHWHKLCLYHCFLGVTSPFSQFTHTITGYKYISINMTGSSQSISRKPTDVPGLFLELLCLCFDHFWNDGVDFLVITGQGWMVQGDSCWLRHRGLLTDYLGGDQTSVQGLDYCPWDKPCWRQGLEQFFRGSGCAPCEVCNLGSNSSCLGYI